MKIIVTHASADLDGITSIWLIKKFLPGWEEAKVQFVPAGERIGAEVAYENFRVHNAKKGIVANSKQEPANVHSENFVDSPRLVIEKIDEDEVIHVDTGLSPLDHHQTASTAVSAASLTFDFVKTTHNSQLTTHNSEKARDRTEAISRIVKIVVETDHFKEVFWKEPLADYHDFSFMGIIDGLKFAKPNQDAYYVTFGIECLDYLLHYVENRIWAEKEIEKNGKKFKVGKGIVGEGLPANWRGIAFETLNDSVLKLAQKMGYALVVRKDPRKGYIRIKARPCEAKNCKLDLTPAYEKLKRLDPHATWFLHVSRHMLLNGTPKNPKMKATKLSLDEIIRVLEKI